MRLRENVASQNVVGLGIRLIIRASVVHDSIECAKQSMLTSLLTSRLCCVCEYTFVSEFASTLRFDFCTFSNMTITT